MKAQMQAQVQFQPYAECENEGCGWERDPGPTTRDEAKRHVVETGHDVIVTVENRTLYKRVD